MEQKAEYSTDKVEQQDIDDTLEMMGKGYPVVQFEPPSEQIVETREGTYEIAHSLGWVKLSAYFRENMLAKLKGAKLSVFICICLHVNEHGQAFPSIDTIAKETDLHRDTVMDTIAELESVPGLLSVVRRRGQKSVYRPAFAARGKEREPYIPVGKTSTTPVDQPVDQPVDVSSTTPVDVSPTLSREEEVEKEEKRKNTAAYSAYMVNAGLIEARNALEEVAGILTEAFIPKVDVVCQLLSKYERGKVIGALRDARTAWGNTERKNGGGKYSVYNPAWVDWAVAHLAGETPWRSNNPQTATDRALADLQRMLGNEQ